jgi:hypothetical protein
VEQLLQGGEAVQGAVHAGRPHEEAHGGKATPLHCKSAVIGTCACME